jgi:LmbE family N-acetylglucosaminyl deacetylase
MNQPTNQNVLAFMAHPDDAEFLCAGTLIRLVEVGWDVHIATAAPGDCGTTSETPWAISARRTEEARQAASLIGATYHCLDERDGYVMYDKPTLRKCMDLFRRVAPSLVITHAMKDYMLDHEMVSLLARAASLSRQPAGVAPRASRHGRVPRRDEAAGGHAGRAGGYGGRRGVRATPRPRLSPQ